MPKRVVVVGGANTDIVGRSASALVSSDSNPGHVRVSCGGVGRNIAENLARLGLGVEFVTALGDDHNATELARLTALAGVGMSHAHTAPGTPGSVYLAILDAAGDMALALSDMRALDTLTPEALAEREDAIVTADLVVIDANPSPESLAWVVDRATAPVLLDPVSTSKAVRARGLLGGLAALKCNASEAATLLGDGPDERGGIGRPSFSDRLVRAKSPAEKRAWVEEAAERLLALGVGAVYVSAGPLGVRFAGGGMSGWVDPPAVEIVNATGAGDALCAGVAAGMLQGFSVKECALLGTVLAGYALTSESTVSELVGPDVLTRTVKEVRA